MAKVIKDEEVFVSTRHDPTIKKGLMDAFHNKAKTKSGRYSFKDFMGEEYEAIIKRSEKEEQKKSA